MSVKLVLFFLPYLIGVEGAAIPDNGIAANNLVKRAAVDLGGCNVKNKVKGECVQYKSAFYCCPIKGKGKCIPCNKCRSYKKNMGIRPPFVVFPWLPPYVTCKSTTPPRPRMEVPVPVLDLTRQGPLPITVMDRDLRPPPPLPPYPLT